jgi:hypothetical protein
MVFSTSLNGVLSVLIDGATPASGAVALNTNGTAALTKVTVSAAAIGTHTLQIVGDSGTKAVAVLGCECSISNQRKIRVRNMGYGGSRTDVWSGVLKDSGAPTNGYPWNSPNAFATIGGHLTVINLGINDIIAGTANATYAAQLETLVASERARGAAVTIAGPTPIGNANYPTLGLAYLSSAKRFAAKYGARFVSYDARWGGFSKAVSDGLIAADNLHNTAKGYADKAMCELHLSHPLTHESMWISYP